MPSDALKSLESPGVRGDGVHPVITGVYAFYLTKTRTKMFFGRGGGFPLLLFFFLHELLTLCCGSSREMTSNAKNQHEHCISQQGC